MLDDGFDDNPALSCEGEWRSTANAWVLRCSGCDETWVIYPFREHARKLERQFEAGIIIKEEYVAQMAEVQIEAEAAREYAAQLKERHR